MEDQRALETSIPNGLPARLFAEQLRSLRTAVGNPSFRKMAGRSGRISHTTLHEAAAGTRFPSWETTREFVRACEADEIPWRARWEEAQRSRTICAVPDSDRIPVISDSPALGVASSDLVPVGSRELRPAERPPATTKDGVTRGRRHRLLWLAVAVATVTILGVSVRGRWSPDDSGPTTASSPSAGFSDALIPGDSSKFVADVTIPDGTRVKENAHFTKVWAFANVGSVDWHNRFLERINPTGDDDGCRVPDRVTIGDTPPGEKVMVSVPVVAPNRPGKCMVSWKMVDEHGNTYFPSRRPVYFMVTVIA
jgi:hypothetical protein